MDSKRIEEIRKRVEAATPKPWCMTWSITHGPLIWGNGQPILTSAAGLKHSMISENSPEPQWQKDMLFILDARSDIPDLVTALEEAQREIERLNGQVDLFKALAAANKEPQYQQSYSSESLIAQEEKRCETCVYFSPEESDDICTRFGASTDPDAGQECEHWTAQKEKP